MRPHSAQGGSIRFLSREYHETLGALKVAPPTSATLITLAGGAPSQLKAGAEQLARSLGRNLFRVNLGGIVSKYIGETEKNLAMLFARAQSTEWVLYFEDGDALFGRGGESTGTQGLGPDSVSQIVEKLGAYRGFIVAVLRQPPQPAQAHRKIRHFHITFPPV
jgi:SpoVK/Ycf46/Vps4 family AAA+-type ATPase